MSFTPNPGTYEPHSYKDHTVIDVGDATYDFTKPVLQLNHIQVWGRAPGGLWFQFAATTHWLAAGPSGSVVVTFTAAGLALIAAGGVNSLIRIKRVTPDTVAGRLVDFTAGSLTEADLDTSALQSLYISQEVRDEMQLKVGLTYGAETSWDLKTLRGSNAGDATAGTDTARLEDVNVTITASGNLPTPTPAQEGDVLLVQSGAWVPTGGATVRTAIGLGAAAERSIGVLAPDIRDNALAEAQFAARNANLSDMSSAATSRSNLGLGTAAVLNVGTAALDVVQLTADTPPRLPAVDGRDVDLTNNASVNVTGKVLAKVCGVIGDSSQVFNTTYATVGIVNNAHAQYSNSPAEVYIDAANDKITLKIANANYWVRIFLQVANESISSDVGFIWRLIQAPSTILHTAVRVDLAPKGTNYRLYTTLMYETLITTTVADTDIRLEAKEDTFVGGDCRITSGLITVERIG